MSAEFEVGVRSTQLVQQAGDQRIPLVNIINRHNLIIGGVHSEDMAKRIVRLLNEDEDRIAAKMLKGS